LRFLATFFSLVFLYVVLSTSAYAQDGLQLLRKMQTALGGADKIAAIRDYDETERGNAWTKDGKLVGEVIKRTRWSRPSQLRLDQTGPGNSYILYFDGAAGWEILPTKGDKTVIDLVGGELQFAQKYIRDLDFHVWLADRDPRYRISSPEPNVIRIADSEDPSHQLEIALDPITWRPEKEITISLADPANPQPSERRIEEWQVIQGIYFPRRIANFHSGVRLAEGTVEVMKLNIGLKSEDLSAKPLDLNPVLTGR
jgi:hypothetical protein